MLPIEKLNFGFNDGGDYRRRENKELLNQFFIRTDALDKLVQGSYFFLMGEKGTGKTAYAVYSLKHAGQNLALSVQDFQ